jgi:hypothetical protein
VAGWSYQWISQLDWATDSWTAPIDARRLPPQVGVTDATVAQINPLVGLLDSDGDVPLFVFHAGYDPIALADVRTQVLVNRPSPPPPASDAAVDGLAQPSTPPPDHHNPTPPAPAVLKAPPAAPNPSPTVKKSA